MLIGLRFPLVFIPELLEATLRSLPCGPHQWPSCTYNLSAQFLLSANLTRSGPFRYFSFDELNPLTTHWRSNIPLFTGFTHSMVKNLEAWHAEVCVGVCVSHFSHVGPFAILWIVACQASLSMGFSRQEHWSGLPCPPPEDLPDPGIETANRASCIDRQILYH